jgi:hypothetical protein
MKSLVLIIILAIGFMACSGTHQIHSPEGHGFYLRAGLVKPTGNKGIFIVQGMDVNGRILGPRYRARFLTTPHVGDCVLVCREQIIQPKF